MKLNDLKKINWLTEEIEEELHGSIKNRELIELLNLEKSLVYFTTSLRSNDLMMTKLQRVKNFSLTEDESDSLEDIVIDNRQHLGPAKVKADPVLFLVLTHVRLLAHVWILDFEC